MWDNYCIMAKLEKPFAACDLVSERRAQEIIANPNLIKTPDGLGDFIPGLPYVSPDGRHFTISGTSQQEKDVYDVSVQISLPGVTRRALAKLRRQQPQAVIISEIHHLDDSIANIDTVEAEFIAMRNLSLGKHIIETVDVVYA